MSSLNVPWWVWAATIGVIAAILGAELVIGIRRGAREVSMRSAAGYTAAVVAGSALFGLGVAWLGSPAAAGQFYAGWLTEYSLSLDNLFIFVLLIGGSAVPMALHSRVLLLGVAMALVLRGIFIAVGAAAIGRFSWILYIFGAVLIGTAARLALSRGEHQPGDSPVLRAARRVIPVAGQGTGGRLLVRAGGRTAATPLLFLVIAVGLTDLVFALDSIPAIFGLTRDPYLVFAANAFALLGLRQLYFLIAGLLRRLVYLSAGLAVILAFIGGKLITEALADSGVTAVGPVPVPHISTAVSLAVIAAVLSAVTVASLLVTRRRARRQDAARASGARRPRVLAGPGPPPGPGVQ
jgi:tellurite resistance protein TerC